MNQKTVSGSGISLRPRTNRGTAVTTTTKKRSRVYERKTKQQRQPRGTKRANSIVNKAISNDKGKEEANDDNDRDYEEIFDDEGDIDSIYSDESMKRLVQEQIEEIEEDSDNDAYHMAKEKPSKERLIESAAPMAMRYEVVNRKDVTEAVTINMKYMKLLLKEINYARSVQVDFRLQEKARERVKHLDQCIEATSRALEDWGLPITQWGSKNDQMVRPVAPAIPEADGSEYRFTVVAKNLGLDWSQVDDYQKQDVYNKAAQYHKETYGTYPNKIKVWTKNGQQPMYYYNKATYEATMQRALKEFMSL